jgi:hypothetical protein
MHIKKSFLHSKTAKTSNATMLIIIAVVAVGAFMLYQGGYLDDLNLPFSIGGTEDGIPAGMVSANKKLQFTWTAEYSGNVANAKTFYIYDSSLALRETLTTAATGIVASAQNYPSGTVLHVKYDDTNNQVWYTITVPYMSEAEAQAQTYNDISLKFYEIGTYTVDDLRAAGIIYADASTYNCTTNGTTPMFTYTLSNTGADNTGLLESYDPVYSQAWDVWVTGTITGDNASLVILNGVDYSWKVGNDWYFADKVSASALSKWKVGLSYVPGYTGTDSCTFGMDLSAFTTAADTATMQITAYACADPAYAISHAGNFGANKVTIAEQTVSIVGL